MCDTIEPIDNPTEELHVFPSVSTHSDLWGVHGVDDTGSYLFDSNVSLSDLSITSMSLDYHNCPCIEDYSSLFIDWTNLDIFHYNTDLDYSQDSLSSTITSSVNRPIPLAYNTQVRWGITRSFDNTVTLGDLFSIIVDSGANLSTPPRKPDFIGPIKKIDLRLGWMANGIIIKGKRKVEWSFVTQNGKNLL